MEGYNRLRPIHHYIDMKLTNVKNTERKRTFTSENGKKKEGVIFSKVCSTRLLLLPTRPADSTRHTHIPSKDPQPSAAALTHCQTYYKSLHLHVYTHLAWSVNGKALSLNVGRHFLFVCLESMPAALNLISWRKQRKKGKWKVRVKGRLIYGNDWLMFLLGFSQWEAAECLHPHSIAKVSDWLQSDK